MVQKKTKTNKSTPLNILLYVTLFILVVISFFNLFISQSVPELYFSLLNNNRESSIIFLKTISTIPEFKNEMDFYKKKYGADFEKNYYTEEMKRDEKIRNLERLLEKNQKHAPTLILLSRLYNEKGDKTRELEYMNKAKLIDPTIKTNE